MKFILVPLSLKETMVYCQKTATLPLARSKPRIDDRLAQKAATTWTNWAKSDVAWKKKIVSWADRAMERISYEEWSLKSIPAKNAFLRRTSEKTHVTVKELEQNKHLDPEAINVEYPASMLSMTQVEERLRKLALHGKSHHKKYFLLSAIGAPLTLPFAAVPVIPNLPGFFLCFRAWSNWKAYEGAKHLSYLVHGNHLNYQDSEKLSHLYKYFGDDHSAVLKNEHVDKLAEDLGASEMAPEIHRAIKQVRRKHEK